MIGETIRSWGQDRNLLFVIDDFLIGIPLIVTAVLMRKPTTARWCAFSASFAATAGALYGSFFGKWVDLSNPAASNIDIHLLTALIGLAFASSLIGLIACLQMSGSYQRHPEGANQHGV